MTKEDNKNFKNSTKCWICDDHCVDNDVQARDHSHITGKYSGSAHRNYKNNLKLNHKISIVFLNSKKYDSHLIMEELVKFSLKKSVIPNRLETYMSLSINNKLRFIASFQFLSSSLDILDKNLNDFRYLRQELDTNLLDLVKQKVFYPYEYMSNFEKFKDELPNKEKFYSSLTDKKLVTKNMNIFLIFWGGRMK